MGDDVNDLEAMEMAGLAAAPADAVPAVLERATFISTKTRRARSRPGTGGRDPAARSNES